ncbi:MAG TPA: hypothetical protein VGR26_01535, partial [Acidimicrobiales bacterium]|nr:hypothetical protein [Acidimicrobiales bacterium]
MQPSRLRLVRTRLGARRPIPSRRRVPSPAAMPPLASFHLHRYPARHAVTAMADLVARRRALEATPGLRFARRLGTGKGSAMGFGGDLRRWATFAVWDDDEALDAFLSSSPVAARWAEHAEETWSVRLAPLSAHGSWGGVAVLAGMAGETPPAADRGPDEPVAVLTRARIRVRHWPAFYRSVPAVDDHFRRSPGILAALGIGEAPVGLQATFSLWRSV